MNKRKLRDGREVEEFEQPMILTIKTRCPSKWLLVDQETGEAYVSYDTPGTQQWKKVYKAEWSIDA